MIDRSEQRGRNAVSRSNGVVRDRHVPGATPVDPGPPPARTGPAAGPRRPGLRVAAVAVLVGLLVTALVAGVFALLPGRWEGRVGLLALPSGSTGSALISESGVSTSYGEVVTLAMPSIADLVTSPSTLDAVAAAVPGSPPPDELADDVSVELLAGSGVARVSVRAGSPELAARLAEAFAGRVAAADLLAPAGTLRVLDRQATLLEKGPDLTLGVGLGLIAGTLAGLGTAAVLVRRVRARRGDARRSVLSTLVAAGHGIVPVLSARDADAGERLLVLARAAGGPVRVAAGSPGVADAVLALQSDLAREPGTGAGGGTDESLVLVVDRAADGADLDAAVRALRPGTRVLAAVVS
jgi:capsular polysaccharide biosynthesis protein